MRTVSALLFLAACGGVPATGEESSALYFWSPPPQLILLSVDAVDGAVAEHRPAYVHFTLTNSTSKTHTGWVKATVPQANGTLVDSNAFQVSLAPGASGQGVVEFDAPYAGNQVPYTLHYFDATAPTTPAESTASGFTLAVAIRARFLLNEVFVPEPADPTLGDNDSAWLQTMRNGAQVALQSEGLGQLFPFSYSYPSVISPMADLVPGTADAVTYNAWIHLQPNWIWGASATPAQRTLVVTADVVRSLIPDSTFTGDASPMAEHYDYFCNGYPSTGSCPNGNMDYRLGTAVQRVARFGDTILMDQHVAQIGSDESFLLNRHVVDGSWVTWVVADGGPGAVINGAYIPPTSQQLAGGRALVKILGVDPRGRAATVYVEAHAI